MWVPAVPAPGCRESGGPSPLSERHAGGQRAAVSVSVGGVKPVVVTVNVPAVPTVKVVLVGLVMAGKV